jgi:hypothetical protein
VVGKILATKLWLARCGQTTNTLFAWLISHQQTVLFSQNKSAPSNQPAVLFSQNKPAPAISHQPNEQAESSQFDFPNHLISLTLSTRSDDPSGGATVKWITGSNGQETTFPLTKTSRLLFFFSCTRHVHTENVNTDAGGGQILRTMQSQPKKIPKNFPMDFTRPCVSWPVGNSSGLHSKIDF